MYIYKNYQYWYYKNRNYILLLLLLLINKYNTNSINNTGKATSLSKNKDNVINSYKSNTISKGTNSSITTNINNENTTINNKKHNLIHSIKNINKTTSIINNEYNNINSDKGGATSKSTDKDSLVNRDTDTITNIDRTTKGNKDNSKSNNKNSDPVFLKNKFITPTTETHNKLLTNNNPCKKNKMISISNTLKQLPLAKAIIDKNQFANHFNLKAPEPLTDLKAKVPVLIGATKITEVFHGEVIFSKPIISILRVTNQIFITNKSISPTLHSQDNTNTVLNYEGFLKIHLEYLEDVIIEESQIKCDSKYYIMFIPFLGEKDLNVTDEIINSSNIVLQDFALDINKSTFSVDTCLEEPCKGNKYINLYKICNLTLTVDCDVSLYITKLVHL